jgi:hypothetical protein
MGGAYHATRVGAIGQRREANDNRPGGRRPRGAVCGLTGRAACANRFAINTQKITGGAPMTAAEMLNIFRSNIVYMRGVPASDVGGNVDYLKFGTKVGAVGVVRSGSGEINVPVKFVESATVGDADAFPTWICDYAADTVKYKTLSNARPFCFTANMNGCTFGIGAAVAGGVVTVSHANATTAGGGNLATQTAQQKLQSAVVPGAKLFEPKDYDFSGLQQLNTTLVGILNGNDWTFYYQQFVGQPGGFNYKLKTFKKIDVNALTSTS